MFKPPQFSLFFIGNLQEFVSAFSSQLISLVSDRRLTEKIVLQQTVDSKWCPWLVIQQKQYVTFLGRNIMTMCRYQICTGCNNTFPPPPPQTKLKVAQFNQTYCRKVKSISVMDFQYFYFSSIFTIFLILSNKNAQIKKIT